MEGRTGAKRILDRAISRGLIAQAGAHDVYKQWSARAGQGEDVSPLEVLREYDPSLDDATLAALDDRSLIGRTLGGFELVSKLGEGGMGVVFLAVQKSLGRKCALKIMSASLAAADESIERFKLEARAAAQLDHPHVVQPIDFGEDGGFIFFAMELMEGGSGASRLERQGPFSEAQAIEVGIGIGRALEFAEERQLVHRDLKPDNILFSRFGTPKLGDLGLVLDRTSQRALTEEGSTLGTSEYMAPEQIRGQRDLDGRTDIYALGITLFELLAGRAPFEGDDDVAVMTQHLVEPMPDVRKFAPGVSAGLAAVIAKMTARDREDRYPTATEMRAALERVAKAAAGVEAAREAKDEAAAGGVDGGTGPRLPHAAGARASGAWAGSEPRSGVAVGSPTPATVRAVAVAPGAPVSAPVSVSVPVPAPASTAPPPLATAPTLAPPPAPRWVLLAGAAALLLVLASAITAAIVTSGLTKRAGAPAGDAVKAAAAPPPEAALASAPSPPRAQTLGRPVPLIRFDATGQPEGWVVKGEASFTAETDEEAPDGEPDARALIATGTGALRGALGAGPWRVEGRVRPGVAPVRIRIERVKGGVLSLSLLRGPRAIRAAVESQNPTEPEPALVPDSAVAAVEGDTVAFSVNADEASLSFEANGRLLADVPLEGDPPRRISLAVTGAAGARFSDLTLRLPKEALFVHTAAQRARAASLVPRFGAGPNATADGGSPEGPKLVGGRLPRARLTGPKGEAVDLAPGRRGLVLVVLRGYPNKVCLECSCMTLALADLAKEFERREARVVVLFPGPAETVPHFLSAVRSLREGMTTVPFPIALDPDLSFVDALGVKERLAKPAVVVVDAKGVIRYAYVGRSALDRPSARELLTVLDDLPK